jgi:hypothetical protein
MASTSGISIAADATGPIGERRDIELDALARVDLALRLSGRCSPYFENRMCASSDGPARPRAIGCEGTGGYVIASQVRHEYFSRTCWITFHWRGISSRVSVTASPDRSHLRASSTTGRSARRCNLHVDPDRKVNDADPQAWLADVVARLQAKRINKVLPWSWKSERQQKATA